jgi:hypothetical protein
MTRNRDSPIFTIMLTRQSFSHNVLAAAKAHGLIDTGVEMAGYVPHRTSSTHAMSLT